MENEYFDERATYIAQLIAHCLKRVQEARSAANDMRHDDRLHRLAMKTVFVLEDMLETLVAMQEDLE